MFSAPLNGRPGLGQDGPQVAQQLVGLVERFDRIMIVAHRSLRSNSLTASRNVNVASAISGKTFSVSS